MNRSSARNLAVVAWPTQLSSSVMRNPPTNIISSLNQKTIASLLQPVRAGISRSLKSDADNRPLSISCKILQQNISFPQRAWPVWKWKFFSFRIRHLFFVRHVSQFRGTERHFIRAWKWRNWRWRLDSRTGRYVFTITTDTAIGNCELTLQNCWFLENVTWWSFEVFKLKRDLGHWFLAFKILWMLQNSKQLIFMFLDRALVIGLLHAKLSCFLVFLSCFWVLYEGCNFPKHFQFLCEVA